LKDVNQVMLCGLETHVCILQTAVDLLERGYEVHLLVDAISSQRQQDRDVALARMDRLGAFLTTTESALFQMLGDAKHPNFKGVSALVKEERSQILGYIDGISKM